MDQPPRFVLGQEPAAIADTLRSLRGQVTTIIVAHRLATVRCTVGLRAILDDGQSVVTSKRENRGHVTGPASQMDA